MRIAAATCKENAVIQAVKLSIVVGSVFQCFMLPHDAK